MQSISVSRLVLYLKNKLDGDVNLHNFYISGEISNFRRQLSSGHLYFTLKDETSQIACVMFRFSASKLTFEPKSGDKVLAKATASIFESAGQLQLYISDIKLDGLGELFQRYEALKNKLNAEGYFDIAHKKELTNKYLEKVAVLVGDKSAAMSEIKTTFSRRWPLAKVDYYPVIVQGDTAPASIIENLLKVDKLGYDAIILARGGGSFEDLFCFNDETLVKTIYNLKTFIITGIGHEQDFTLCDFVADLRAPTPTASVELITANVYDLFHNLEDYNNRLKRAISLKLSTLRDKYKTQINSNVFLNPHSMTQKKALKLDYYSERLKNFNHIIITHRNLIDNYRYRLNISINNIVKDRRTTIKRLMALIKAYSSEDILSRGYSLSFKDGHIIRSISDVKIDDDIEIKVKDGLIISKIKELKDGRN